jgi:hypothetical protein
VARRATEVVRIAAVQPLAWVCRHRSNHPRRGLGRGRPSLLKEGSPLRSFTTETSLVSLATGHVQTRSSLSSRHLDVRSTQNATVAHSSH